MRLVSLKSANAFRSSDTEFNYCIQQSSNFWIIARAIKDFVYHEGAGLLPIPGKLPDMKADTKSYVQLQQM
jgi:hypothetical protein